MTIASAGNTEIPAILAMEHKGAEIVSELESNTWTATYLNNTYVANTPLELLGLIEMHAVRGGDWKATDIEIARCATKYSALGIK